MRKAFIGAIIGLLGITSACGGEQREFAGFVRTPAPSSQGITLPNIASGADRELIAGDDNHLV
ncbi:MAG: hypothetical protein ACO35F_05010, partial [Ilumatobacteraceae bacterium]